MPGDQDPQRGMRTWRAYTLHQDCVHGRVRARREEVV